MGKRTVIITGASSGIGATTALRLAQDGWCVALVARRTDLLHQVAEQVVAKGGQALAIPGDISRVEDIDRIVQTIQDQWGRIDALVNNAGGSVDRKLVDMTLDDIENEVRVNYLAVIEVSRAVIPIMLRQGSGHILNVASIAGLVGLPNSTIYSSTKAAVVSFSDGLRRELRGTGVHVTAFCPGFTATPFSQRLNSYAPKGVRRPPGVMTVQYVANRIAFLLDRKRRIDIIPKSWTILVWLAGAFPYQADQVIQFFSDRLKE